MQSRFRLVKRVMASAFVVVALVPPGAALGSAEPSPPSCDHDWGEIASFLRLERREGVTVEWLDEINDLIPQLISCTSGLDGDGQPLSGVDRWAPLVASFFLADDVERVLCLMEHESKGDPGAVNPTSGATGLMQVMPSWARKFGYRRSDLKDPLVNLEISAWIRDNHGWRSWSPYQRGLCRGDDF